MFLKTCFLILDILLHKYSIVVDCDFFVRLWGIIQLSRQTKSKYIYRGLIWYFIRNLFISTNCETLDKQTTNSISLLCTRDLSWVLNNISKSEWAPGPPCCPPWPPPRCWSWPCPARSCCSSGWPSAPPRTPRPGHRRRGTREIYNRGCSFSSLCPFVSLRCGLMRICYYCDEIPTCMRGRPSWPCFPAWCNSG